MDYKFEYMKYKKKYLLAKKQLKMNKQIKGGDNIKTIQNKQKNNMNKIYHNIDIKIDVNDNYENIKEKIKNKLPDVSAELLSLITFDKLLESLIINQHTHLEADELQHAITSIKPLLETIKNKTIFELQEDFKNILQGKIPIDVYTDNSDSDDFIKDYLGLDAYWLVKYGFVQYEAQKRFERSKKDAHQRLNTKRDSLV